MKKLFFCYALLCVSTSTVFAGGLVTNSNQSATFIRNAARDAMIGVDAAYYNPAGVVFMDKGVHFGFNNQSAFQQRNVTGSLMPSPMGPITLDFSSTMSDKKYEGSIVSPIIPSIDFAYVSDRWSLSSHFGIPGGGGACEYDEGLPMFDAMIRASIFNKMYTTTGNFAISNGATLGSNVGSSFTGKTYMFGWQVGGAYKLTDDFSLALSVRLNYYKANYEGEVKYTVPTQAETVFSLDCDQAGLGITPILGVNYKSDRLSVAAKYEFGTCITAENDTKEFPEAFASVPSLSRFKDGEKTHADQPALLTIGTAYNFTPSLIVSAGYHYYFDKDANYNGLEKLVDKNTVEYLLGVEYKINDKWLVSCGGQISQYNISDDYNTNTGFIMSSYSLTGGFRYSINEKLALDLGCMWTNYDDFEKTSTYGGVIKVKESTYGGVIKVKESYERTNIVPAIGVVWDL